MKNSRFKFTAFFVCISVCLSLFGFLPAISGETVPPFRMSVYPNTFELRSGKETVLEMTLENSGKNPLRSLSFDIDSSAGLRILCDPSSIPLLNRGESIKIKLRVHPQRTILQKSIQVPFGVRSEQYQIKETVQFVVSAPEGMWMKTGFFLAALVLIIFTVIFIQANKDNPTYQEEDHDSAGA
jgi:uncharacterized membrane protein